MDTNADSHVHTDPARHVDELLADIATALGNHAVDLRRASKALRRDPLKPNVFKVARAFEGRAADVRTLSGYIDRLRPLIAITYRQLSEAALAIPDVPPTSGDL